MKTQVQNKTANFVKRGKITHFFQIGQHRRHLPSCPGILISLWDIMNEMVPLDIYLYARAIADWYKKLNEKPSGYIFSADDKKELRLFASDARIDELSRLGWPEARSRLVSLMCLAETFEDVSAEIALHNLMEFDQALLSVLCTWKCVQISPEKTKYINQKPPWKNTFPSANMDMKAAGNCIALDLNTAAVFHLMRVVERGLRAFAKHLRVPIPNAEIEYKDWKVILDRIPDAINAKLSGKKMSSKRRSEILEFYSGITGQFEFFKDVWRNHCIHARKHYDSHQAQSAFDHVKDFMQRLATRVSETK